MKEVAPQNIAPIFVTLLVSKFETSPLKENAELNISCIFVTLLVYLPLFRLLSTGAGTNLKPSVLAPSRVVQLKSKRSDGKK